MTTAIAIAAPDALAAKLEFKPVTRGNRPRKSFAVLIDGEHRADLHPSYHSRGYRIHTVDGDPITPSTYTSHVGAKVDTKAEFDTFVRDLLAAGLIPTVAETQARRDRRAAATVAYIAARKADMATWIKTKHVDALYAALAALDRATLPAPVAAMLDDIDARIAASDAELDAGFADTSSVQCYDLREHLRRVT